MVYEEHIILEAIDQLRLRKARPDYPRINNFLVRNFSISPSEVKAALDKCVQSQVVLKVEYKGNISYRNAARNKRLLKVDKLLPYDSNDKGEIPTTSLTSMSTKASNKRSTTASTAPTKKFKPLLANAFAELIVHEPDYLYDGVPGNELISKILSKDTVRSYTKKYLSILIEKLTANGVLIKVSENGNYLLGPNLHDGLRSDNKLPNDKKKKVVKINPKNKAMKPIKKLSKMETGGNSNKNNAQRLSSRRKRAIKKVFDPSDNNIPKRRNRTLLRKSSSEKSFVSKTKERESSDSEMKVETLTRITPPPVNREQGGVCSVCHNNKKVLNDHMVSCRECSNKAHYNCLNGDDMLLKMYPDNTWQCPHCKTCCICYETSDAGILMVCSICADAYHAGCHEPRVTDKMKNGVKWLCNNCQMSETLQVNEIHPNVYKSDIIKHELYEELDIKEELPALELSSVSSSEEDSKDSLQCSQTPPVASPQLKRSPASSPTHHIHYNGFQNNISDSEYQEKIDPSIPDASLWSCDDVFNYFVQYFPEEAKVFKEQEIDGRSLLLMKRLDILTSLKLKLGPALKIYRHVVKLQFRRDDPKLYWL